MSLYQILFFAIIAAEIVIVPLFLKYSWPNKTWTSFSLKTVASLLFLSAGFCSVQIAQNTSTYADLILWGLFFGVIGDVLLHVICKTKAFFAVGACSFLIGHVFYINAFQAAIEENFPNASMFAWYEVLPVVLFLVALVTYVLVKKPSYKKVLAPMSVYAAVIGFMVCKAVSCFGHDWMWGMRESFLPIFVTVVIGAFLFIASDITLVILTFESMKTKRWLKVFNILTYYTAQLLLGASIMYIRTRA